MHWVRGVIKLSYCDNVKRKYFFSQWGKVCLCDKIKSCQCNNLISIQVSSVSQDWESYKYRWSDFVEEIFTKFYVFNYFLCLSILHRSFWGQFFLWKHAYIPLSSYLWKFFNFTTFDIRIWDRFSNPLLTSSVLPNIDQFLVIHPVFCVECF